MTKIFPHCTISVGLAPLADKYINIYTRNLKFAQLVTALASLAQLYQLMSEASSISLRFTFSHQLLFLHIEEALKLAGQLIPNVTMPGENKKKTLESKAISY